MLVRSLRGADELKVLVGRGDCSFEKVMLGCGRDDAQEEMMVRGRRGSLLLQRVMGRSLRFRLLKMMTGRAGGFLLEQMLLRSRTFAELERSSVTGFLGRLRWLWRFRRPRRLGRGQPDPGDHAQHKGGEREERGGSAPFHGAALSLIRDGPREKRSFRRRGAGL